MQITIHENKEDYLPEEVALLTQAYNELELKAQSGNLTLEETRVRVAYNRYQRESNFKIAILPTKKIKEPKEPKVVGERKTRTKKEVVPKVNTIERASQLFYRQRQGEELTDEEVAFLEMVMSEPPKL